MSIEKTCKCRTYVDVDGSSKCRPDMVDICAPPYSHATLHSQNPADCGIWLILITKVAVGVIPATAILKHLLRFHGIVSSLKDFPSINFPASCPSMKSNFRFLLQISEGATLLPMSKIGPPNGGGTKDAAGTAVADQCRSLLIYSAMCPRQAPAASFA